MKISLPYFLIVFLQNFLIPVKKYNAYELLKQFKRVGPKSF